ncbi:MAG: hypothetical protein KDI13_03765 [Alphaproteobacteria bacterium]|nr:hypothetical protein [Alphaproteobacteria bacterium]
MNNPGVFLILTVLELVAIAMTLGGAFMAWAFMNSPEADPASGDVMNFISSPGFYMILLGMVGYHFLRREKKRRKKMNDPFSRK